VDSTFDLVTLSVLPGLQPRVAATLRCRDSVAAVLARPELHADLLPARAVGSLKNGEARRKAQAEVEGAQRRGIAIVGRDDRSYPPLLREIADPPLVLYVKGRLPAAGDDRAIAIVGARAATPDGTALASVMAGQLAAAGASIVSGFARGIDSAAHRGALDADGRTIAVLGSGLEHVYPPENAPLVERVAERGAVISELPLGWGPRPAHFPRRNRIIAGLCRGVVVVEARHKSGALITARLALEGGREVMAVPGHPGLAGAEGTNALIRDGACLVRDAADVALELGLELRRQPGPGQAASALLSAMQVDRPATLEELADRSGRSLPELLAELTELELARQVRRLPGPLYLRRRTN
jgi:DNA processing protein